MGKKSLTGIVLSSIALGSLISGCETTYTPTYQHHRAPSRTIVVPTPQYCPPPRQSPHMIIVPPRSSTPRYIPPRSHSPTFYHPPRPSPGFHNSPRNIPRTPQYCPPPRYIAPRQSPSVRSPSSPSSGSRRFRMNWTH